MALKIDDSSPDESFEFVDTHSDLLELIQTNHDEAYLYVSQGLAYQEENQPALACDMYQKGLEKIDKALNVKTDESYCVGPQWEKAKKLQEKMKKTAQMIKSQIRKLSVENIPVSPVYTPPEPFEMPPSYVEACEHELLPDQSSQRINSFQGIGENINFVSNGRRGSSEVVDLFCIPGDVQLFFVSYDGSVSTSSSLSSLNIYKFVESEDGVRFRPPAWLQIGSWTYPLIPGQSPVFESGYGAFLFPDVGHGRDSAVGVILPPSVTPAQRAEFLELLNQLTALKEERRIEPTGLEYAEETERASTLSEKISKGLVTGAEYLSAGIVKGAHISSDLIHKGASKARERIRPDMQPVSVDPRVKEGLKIAHQASGVALKATGYLVKKLGELTVALGTHIAPHIREQGTKLLTNTFKKDPKEAQDTVDGVLTVAAGGVQGISTIYMGLENAARTLAYSLSTETVNLAGHKYGCEVGEVVDSAVSSIGNLALTTHNVHSLGIKSVAKRTAKDAGKAVLKDYADTVPKK